MNGENNLENREICPTETPGQREGQPEARVIPDRLKQIHDAKKSLARQLHAAGFSMDEIGRILHLRKKNHD
jgi:hypothetical protein